MSPPTASFLTPFHELHRHRALLRQFSARTIEMRHRASFLGVVWTVLSPLISLTIYTFVFGFVFNGRFTQDPSENNLDYAIGIFLGLILFNFLAEVLSGSPNAIVMQPNFVKKVVFPLEILPAAAVGAAAFSAVMSLTLAMVGVTVLSHGLDWQAVWLLAILPPIALIAFGSAWFFSAVGVFIRDIASAMPFAIHILVYISAIFFPMRDLEKLPDWAHLVMLTNPLLHAVESIRRCILWHQSPDTASIAYLWLCGVLIWAGGYFTFRKLRPAFADVL